MNTADLKKIVLEIIGSRDKFTAAVNIIFVCVAIVFVFMPLYGKIKELESDVESAKERIRVINEIEKLKKEIALMSDKMVADHDVNDWLKHIMAGARGHKIKVKELEPNILRGKIGPYKKVRIYVEIAGDFKNIASYIKWLENEKPLLSIEELRMQYDDGLLVSMLIAVLSEKSKEEKKETDREGPRVAEY